MIGAGVGNRVWVTSDTHFGHANIIQYTNRPFDSVEQMNRVMTERWNDVVSPNDTVIHVGDFAMGLPALHQGYFDQLNGEKYLIKGNHDKNHTLKLGWTGVFDDFTMQTPVGDVFFSHHPIMNPEYKKEMEDSGIVLFIHGHQHNPHVRSIRGNRIDVGVDAWGFQPVRLKTLLSYRSASCL